VTGGCSLFLDFSQSQVPVDAMLDAPYSSAQCAYMEPNDSLDTASTFTMADMGPAAICPGTTAGVEDHDFYKFTLPDMSSVTVKIDFDDQIGDLDLRLYDAATDTMQAQSRGFTNTEMITCPGTSPSCPQLVAGDYIFEVFPATTGVTNFYTPSIVITTAAP
jgi:hypothetical protein